MGTMSNQKLSKVSKASKKQQIQLAKSFYEKGLDLWYSYEYDAALEEFNKALVIRESLLGKYHMHTSKTYFSIGCALHGKGDYAQALIALRRNMRIATIKNDKASKSGTTDYIIWVLKKKGMEQYHKEVLDHETAPYLSDLHSAIKHEIQGDTLAAKCSFQAALDEYRHAFALESSQAGEFHADIADLHVKIADMLVKLQCPSKGGGDEDEAVPQGSEAMAEYQKAIEIYKLKFGDEHPHTWAAVQKSNGEENVSTLLPCRMPSRRSMMSREISVQDLLKSDKNSHKVDKAVKHYNCDRSEFRQKRIIYDTPTRYFWMGLGFYGNKEYDEALVAFRRTWRLREAIFGKEHYFTLHALGFISWVLMDHPKYKKGIGRNIERYHRHLFEATQTERKADIFLQKKDLPQALKSLQHAANLEADAVGRNHLEWAGLKCRVGDVLVEMGNYKRASDEYRKALLIYQITLGKGHQVTTEILGKMEAVSETNELLLGISSH